MNSRQPASTARKLTLGMAGAALLLAAFALASCGGGDDNPSHSAGNSGTPPAVGSGAPPAGGALPTQPIAAAAAVTCKDTNFQPMTVQGKTITIYNDAQVPIYPVIVTSANSTDQWMQACERTTTQDFPITQVYKLFVNEGTGVPAGAAVRVTLPLYSALPAGSKDDHITWWNGGRVVLAGSVDDKHSMERLRVTTGANPVDVALATPTAVTCEGEGTSCALTTYANTAQISPAVYAQLSEYTFGNIPPPPGQSEPIVRPANVGYNISYVDHAYLPVAIEPAANPYIGYSGSTVGLSDFATKLRSFVTAPHSIGYDWTVYNLSELKLPGGANVFAEQGAFIAAAPDIPVQPTDGEAPPLLTVMACLQHTAQCTDPRAQQSGQAVQRMENLWSTCAAWAPDEQAPTSTDPNLRCPADLAANMQLIHDFFRQNFLDYQTLYAGGQCSGAMPPALKTFTYAEALKRIYGWVPYNEGCGAAANPLVKTAVNGRTGADIQPIYIQALQYNYQTAEAQNDPRLTFNPYVKLIHDDLQMNAYGFSVDDAVGFMSELGSGLVFTVGGSTGLPNPGQFSYLDGFSVELGVPTNGYVGTNHPFLKSYGVCVYNADKSNCGAVTQDMAVPQSEQITGFRVGTVASYPIRVAFTDVDDNVYSFDVNAKFACPVGTDPANCPTNRAAVYNPASCTVVDKAGTPVPGAQTSWCPANPNSSREPGSTDPQTIKNFLSFNPPLVQPPAGA